MKKLNLINLMCCSRLEEIISFILALAFSIFFIKFRLSLFYPYLMKDLSNF
jgi:hypothetical protein